MGRKIRGFWKPGYAIRYHPQNEKTVPWNQVPSMMQLRNEVSSKGDKSTESVCIQEMALMYSCLKDNDFKDSLCAQQMKAYHDCVFSYMKKKEETRKQMQAGILSPNDKDPSKLNSKQLNSILRLYPQVNKTK